jgi:hypothetical protein
MEWIIRIEDSENGPRYVKAPTYALNLKYVPLEMTAFLSLACVFRTEDEAKEYVEGLVVGGLADKNQISIQKLDPQEMTLARRWVIEVQHEAGAERFIGRGLTVEGIHSDTIAYAQPFLTEEEAERYLDCLVAEQGFDRERAIIHEVAYDDLFELRLDTRTDETSLSVVKENGRWFLSTWYRAQGVGGQELCDQVAEQMIAILRLFDEKLRRLEVDAKKPPKADE